MSDADIGAGERWNEGISRALSESEVGLICVTRDNLDSRWLLFEAGALAKSVDKARVVPILLNLTSTDLQGPLAQFQSVESTKAGFSNLFLTLHRVMEKPLISREDVVANIEAFWPQFYQVIEELIAKSSMQTESAPIRGDRELLEEILKIMRGLGRVEAKKLELKEGIENEILAATLRGDVFIAPGVAVTPDQSKSLGVSSGDLARIPADVLNMHLRNLKAILGSSYNLNYDSSVLEPAIDKIEKELAGRG
jgi:TIR domain